MDVSLGASWTHSGIKLLESRVDCVDGVDGVDTTHWYTPASIAVMDGRIRLACWTLWKKDALLTLSFKKWTLLTT